MKRILRALIALMAIAAVGVAAYVYQFGGPRVKRDLAAFAGPVTSCTPFDQDYYVPMARITMNRTVVGPEDDLCRVTFDTMGPQKLDCAFAAEDLPGLAEALVAQGDQVDIFGYADLHVSTSDPDPLTRMMNSDACEVTGG